MSDPNDTRPSSGASGEASGSSSTSHGTPVARWLITVGGALVVGAVLVYLVVQLATLSGDAALHVTLGEPEIGAGTARIPLTVHNGGGRVAEAAVVEVCAGPDACADIAFDYIPFESEVSGFVTLAAPLAAPLRSRVVAYRDP